MDKRKLYNDIYNINIIIREIAEYIKTKYDGEEVSFHLACLNKGLEDEEISKLFLLYANETEHLSDKNLINKHDLIDRTKNTIDKLKTTDDSELEKIITAYINCYFLRKDD